MAQSDDMKDAAAERHQADPPRRRFPEVERRATAINTLELDPLMTVCPSCGTRFRVTEAQLQAAHGLVRCGTCAAVFDGVDHLLLDSPRAFATTDDAERALDALMEELMSDMRDAAPTGKPADGVEAPPPEGVQQVPAPAELALEPLTAEPQVEAEPVVFQQPRGRHWLWPVAALLVAALGLSAAVIWARYETLVRDPNWRPLFVSICQQLGCTLPEQRALELIRTRNLSVQSRSDGVAGLLVRAVIVNEADFPQVFPTLELTFSTMSGAMVAGHRFQPHEYLDGDARDLNLMPVNRPVQLELSIADPGADAVNYRLRLR